MIKDKKDLLLERINQKSKDFPPYVQRYITYKKSTSSPVTVLNYIHDFYVFFHYMQEQGILEGPIPDIPLLSLEKLKLQFALQYQGYLETKHKGSPASMNRRLSAIKDLFNYLCEIEEDDDGYPLMKRNVMTKIKMKKHKETSTAKANKISSKILWNYNNLSQETKDSLGAEYENKNEIAEFIHHIEYVHTNLIRGQKRLFSAYEKNKERDLAMFSLYLDSGLRLSELLSINVEDINFRDNSLTVMRKGGKEAGVFFGNMAKGYLLKYLEIRESRYHLPKGFKALFVSGATATGRPDRMSERNVQRLLKQYAKTFEKQNLTVHGLRHTFATAYLGKNNDIIGLQEQLGHESISTTQHYAHIHRQELKESVKRVNAVNE
jgi:site-specific recombinase XerD